MKLTFTKNIIVGRHGMILFALLLCSSMLLIAVNWYSFHINGGIRSYLHGESQYSKGEKDAGQSLILYLYTQDKKDYQDFLRHLEIPLSDRKARLAMNANADEKTIAEYFVAGHNHPDDVSNLVWLYEKRNIPFMQKAVQIWQTADSLVLVKRKLGDEARQKITSGKFSEQDRLQLSNSISANNESLSAIERDFLSVLNEIARKINFYLVFFNIALILSLFICIQVLVSTALIKLKLKNSKLRQLNEELDTLIYSVSHDLRSPMASVQGLIHLSKKENTNGRINDYLSKMSMTLEKQNRFIQKIIQTKKNQISSVRQEATNFPELVEQSIQQLMYMQEASGISFSKDIDVEMIKTDELLLEAVINNLIGNSIQYHDRSKPTKFIAIKARNKDKRLVIEISDNGIGIDAHDQQFVFNKFYSSKGARKTSGLGLSIVKDNVEKLQGTIELISQKGIGTSFTISIPVG